MRDLNKLRAKADKLEDGMRSMRLGGGIEMKFKRFSWKAMVICHGWARQDAEEIAPGIEQEFYLFLSAKASALGDEIRAAEKALESLSPATSEGES